MRRNRSSARTVCKALWLVPLLGFCATAAVAPAVQSPSVGQPSSHQQNSFPDYGDSNPIDPAKQMRRLNDDRHKTIVSDTNKLLKLTRELDAEIAANNSDALTTKELHKLAAIEKLAHSVRQKMVLSFGVGPQFHEPTFPSRYPGGPSPGPE
jgi:hypothetical protein